MPSSIKKSPTKISNRRKSVSFSHDTKTDDGDTAQNAFRDWVAEQNALEIEADLAKKHQAKIATASAPAPAPATARDPVAPTTSSPAPAQTGTEAPKAQPQEKQPKSDKTKSADKQSDKKAKLRTPKTEDRPIPEYVKYLQHYHDDRATWKFNKSKQNDMLKNIWSIYRIPSEHNDALIEYLSGLQGAARQRLQDSARTIITEIVTYIRKEIPEAKGDSVDTVEDRQAAFQAAEKREMDQRLALGEDVSGTNERIKTLREKRQEDERAARVLKALLGDAMAAMNATQEVATVDTARQRKKKRKSRTVASDSDSSSDDSESDSDGGSSLNKNKKKKKKQKLDTASDSASSSSSSSSSESASDSESDSDSSSSSESESEDDSSSDAESSSSDSGSSSSD